MLVLPCPPPKWSEKYRSFKEKYKEDGVEEEHKRSLEMWQRIESGRRELLRERWKVAQILLGRKSWRDTLHLIFSFRFSKELGEKKEEEWKKVEEKMLQFLYEARIEEFQRKINGVIQAMGRGRGALKKVWEVLEG